MTAYNKECAVALVVPQKLRDNFGTINYIGVIPNERSKEIVDILIKKANPILLNNITKIIADTDVNNWTTQ
ncbi:hypothetical protein [Clostridium sp. Marseille-Q7071]